MKVQVIVTKEDRSWHSIRDDQDQAMFRVSEHMRNTADQSVAAVGDLVQWGMIFNKGMDHVIKTLNSQGFKVEIKPIGE